MSEKPINPFYMYDGATKEYLQDNLRRTTDEWRRYIKWAEDMEKEIHYIQKKLTENKNG